MPTHDHPRDRFDDIPRDARRIGAHRAENPRGRWVVVLLWVLVVLAVLIAAGIVGFVAILNDSSLMGAAQGAVTETVAQAGAWAGASAGDPVSAVDASR